MICLKVDKLGTKPDNSLLKTVFRDIILVCEELVTQIKIIDINKVMKLNN